ncbi:MAG: hypothetical protein KGJ55_04330 [Gammaproteobacteria bacterium]|nr:hypothetical protein [Gammaproteobacteria bacterium]
MIYLCLQNLRKFFPLIGLGLLGTVLAGCGATGKGVTPVAIIITDASSGATLSEQRAFQCLTSSLSATMQFSDGSQGAATGITWSSSNPGVVEVSNGDIPVSGSAGSVYASGTLVPVTSGSATVTADFEGLLQTSILVTVAAPTDLTIQRVDQGVNSPVSALTVGAGTTQQLAVTGVFDGVERNVTANALWSLSGSLATVDSSGLVTGHGAGGPSQLQAGFAACPLTATAQLTVATVQKLDVQPQFGADPLIMINGNGDTDAIGNIERIDVFADFGSGPVQDVSLQSTLTSSAPAVASFSTNLLTANQPGGPVQIYATLLQGALTSSVIGINVAGANLQSVSVSPASASIVAGSDQTAKFSALGAFDNGQTQAISRVGSWTSSDATVAAISSDGTASSAGTTAGQVTIVATDSNARVAPTASALLNVNPGP